MQQESVGTFSLDDNDWQGVTITDSAAAQITRLMQQDPQIKGYSSASNSPVVPVLPMLWIWLKSLPAMIWF